MDQIPFSCPIPRWELLKQELRNASPAVFDRLRASAPAGALIDVRSPEEYAAFHFDGAVNCDYLGDDFLEQIEALDPSNEYLVYCRSGRRSVRACTLMRNAGITNLIHLDGGLNAYNL
jgi:rhodanese-related sulfurtransferase